MVSGRILDLLAGRSMLMRAKGHLKDHERWIGLTCSLENAEKDHIGLWKQAGKEYGFGNCDDEEFEMKECPRCSAQYAAFKAKRVLGSRVGRINGILTRMGNHLRRKNV